MREGKLSASLESNQRHPNEKDTPNRESWSRLQAVKAKLHRETESTKEGSQRFEMLHLALADSVDEKRKFQSVYEKGEDPPQEGA